MLLHETAHAASAYAFGDDTARQQGKLSLDPRRLVEPFGMVILPALSVLATGWPMGFGSTPVNPRKMRSPRTQSLLVSLAGPAVNVVLAVLAALLLRLAFREELYRTGLGFGAFEPGLAVQALYALGFVNVILSVFNLIPIPPLDGSAVIERLLPLRWLEGWLRFKQYSMLLLMLLVFSGGRLLDGLFGPALDLWVRVIR